MKTRQGFVSNSSSSSFIILLPGNFRPSKDFDWKNAKTCYHKLDGIAEDAWEKSVQEDLNHLLKYNDITGEDSQNVDALAYGLREFQLANVQTGADDQSQISIVKIEKVKKILKIK